MKIIMGVILGLGLFLYGMNLMSKSLEESAGNRLKKIIQIMTKNIFMGILVGAIFTAIIQSSSATTVMVVSFVNAGVMNLNQAIGLIMGANIGTTITTQLISFDLGNTIYIALIIGTIMFICFRNKNIKNIGKVFIGFAILFIGMDIMTNSLNPLSKHPIVKEMLINFGKYPVMGVIVGFGITAIIQSSSAAGGILIALAQQGLLPINSAIYMLYGQNMGTCITALISSVGTNKNAKRAAIMHLTFNIIGTIIFVILLNNILICLVSYLTPDNIPRQIANASTIFNVITVIILAPFSKHIVNISKKIYR
ncbi:MAG: Na/Pi cotransporter family protein [Peptostreptococcaceae bacterium]|jgi:phosphate:Na+ symporter|nr:Na/Pi cotransporter family protein [Peptostreptococcaceae bacterium]